MGWTFLAGFICGILSYIIYIYFFSDDSDLDEYIEYVADLEKENNRLYVIIKKQDELIEMYKDELKNR